MRVFVTGASGLVGFNLVSRLVGAGHAVTGLVRQTSNQAQLSEIARLGRLNVVVGSLPHMKSLTECMAGHQVVVHAAGLVNPNLSRQEIFATNVEGTRVALEAAIEARVEQFVHLSSLSVITGDHDQFGVQEGAPLIYSGEPYADSKVEAEKVVMGELARGKIRITMIRPGFIYGPGERAWLPRLIDALRAGRVALIDKGAKESNVIYVDNLCRAIEAGLLNHRAYGKAFNLTDGQAITKKILFDAICRELGLPPVNRSIPSPVAWLIFQAVSFITPWMPAKLRPSLASFSPAAYRLVGLNQGFDISLAEAELNYKDRIPFAQGMAKTLADYAR